MLGSLPMSLQEMPMAPAVISAAVQRLGHQFKFQDVNLDLFDLCNQDHSLYQHCVQQLQHLLKAPNDPVVSQWLDRCEQYMSQCDVLLINVFSHYSQGAAWSLIQRAQAHRPRIRLLIGGIGSQKKIANADTLDIQSWIRHMLPHGSDQIFGSRMVSNDLVDGWQPDTTMSELYRILPYIAGQESKVSAVDFDCLEIDRYHWQHRRFVPILGSHGCVRQCSFCDVIKHFPSYSFVEADELSQQIVDIYRSTGISEFSFVDSLVNGSMRNFVNMLTNLAHSRQQGWLPQDFSWSGTYIIRPPSKDLNLIHQLLAPSGANVLVIGVETGSDRIRWQMNKKFTNQDLLLELAAFSQHSIRARLLFFAAWPTETLEDFAATVKLLQQLAPWAQQGTVMDICLGTTGFNLIDGTHIDQARDEIGLEPGPTVFLWRCAQNPDLDFWESIRRRFVLAAVAAHYGISLESEPGFIRYLIHNLEAYRDDIQQYCKRSHREILKNNQVLADLPCQHRLKFRVINSGQSAVTVSYPGGTCYCQPGFTEISVEFDKPWHQDLTISLKFDFDDDYQPQWQQHDQGEFYSVNGVYIDNVFVDHRDITLWGFNQIMKQHIKNPEQLPLEYHRITNQRCVAVDSELVWRIPSGCGVHANLLEQTQPERYHEVQSLLQRLDHLIYTFQ